jgi:hypothetical protein
MANNTYGIVRAALVKPEDVEIFYSYRPTRNSEDESFRDWRKIDDVSSIFSNAKLETSSIADMRLPGMYNLNLPVNLFGKKGYYTIYIRPKEYTVTIKDVGSLAAFPEIKGIVLDMNEISDNRSLFENDNLVGYRVEYLNFEGDGLTRQEYYRLVTSNNFCEAVSQNLTTANTSSNGYRFNASGTLCFITVTPSTAPSFKPNATPYIGVPNQKIILINTKFDPVAIEVNMVDHDAETISYMLEGEQVRNLDNGRLTHYNFDGEIYKQFEFSTVKDNYTQRSVAELKQDVSDSIDNSLDLDTLKNA